MCRAGDIYHRWRGRCDLEGAVLMANENLEFLTPQKAWNELRKYRDDYYRKYIAVYSGDRMEMAHTSDHGMFWSRPGKAKVHVPVAADIAATSADLMFSEEPSFVCYDEATEDNESDQQHRLDELVELNNLHGKLNEACESDSVLGDVFLKLNYDTNKVQYPILNVVQGDSAWAEYRLGMLGCVHFFSVVQADTDSDVVIRLYERYEKGRITSILFRGSTNDLGTELPDATMAQLGIVRDIKPPVDEMLAVHIPNMRPNRKYRSSPLGRSDLDGLRGLMDSLDETYSSWMRDIRLAKARLIVPAEYLRRKPADLFDGDRKFTYEFDEDVETLVALDINTMDGQASITSSQFAIRSDEHAATCMNILRNIYSVAGYAPQTFGVDIEGMAQSGTALHIREKKSFNTRGKKQTYWKSPLEAIMTSMVHLDAALFPQFGSDRDDTVKVKFADSMSNDLSTMSSALQMLNSAIAASTEVKVEMLHPDWSKKQIAEEVDRIKAENGLAMDNPDMGLGDFHVTPREDEEEPEAEQDETVQGGEE